MAQKQVYKMGIEGAGPKIMAPAAIAFIVAAALSYAYRPALDMAFVPRGITLTLGAVLVMIGVLIWLPAVACILLAYRKDEMATRGPHALMPNPIYSSWTVFVLPGIALLLNWWLLLAAPIVMYMVFRAFIKDEEDCMRQRYGRKYEEYRNKVLLKFL
ncbi:MAG TPA: methyltransferase [Methanocella sp.]|nr:methyltransferase [Methanocella sp.]